MERAPGQFIFGLHDGECRFAIGTDAMLLHVAPQRLAQTRGRRDGIPRRHRNAGKHASQGRGRITVDDDLARRRVHALDPIGNLAPVKVLPGELPANLQRLFVQRHRLGLPLELLPERDFHFSRIDFDQFADNANVNHVGQEFA
jgi:hypothetical protein